MGPSAWLVIPTYDEAANLEPLVAAALAVLHSVAPDDHRVLVVDDSSPDGTGRVADRLATGDPRVEVLHRAGRRGLGPAYLDGFAHALGAGADYVLQMDADFSHDPADLARLLAAVRAGSDLALGSRYVPGGGVSAAWHPLRRAVSRAGCWYARTTLRAPVRDLTGGFKCLSAATLEAIDLAGIRSQGYAFQVEVTYRALRAGHRVTEVPIQFGDRRHGRSKMSPRIALEAAWRVPLLRRRAHRPGSR